MIRILKESLQDVENYLQTSDLRDQILNEFPDVRDNPESVEFEVVSFIVDLVSERFPDEPKASVDTVTVLKVIGNDIDPLSTSHVVVKFNNNYYDFTAHQFSDSFRNLNFSNVPVVQSVITNERQVSEGVSTVKSYVLLGE